MAWTTPRSWATSELVTAALMNTHLRDNLAYLLTPNYVHVLENSGTYTTTSSSPVIINANYSVSITMNGGHLLMGLSGRFTMSTAAQVASIGFDVDGTPRMFFNTSETNNDYRADESLVYLWTGLSAGARTISVKWMTSGGTLTAQKAIAPLVFWALEI